MSLSAESSALCCNSIAKKVKRVGVPLLAGPKKFARRAKKSRMCHTPPARRKTFQAWALENGVGSVILGTKPGNKNDTIF
jgi:hypothetical protein